MAPVTSPRRESTRCIEVSLENSGETWTAFAARAREIARREGIDGLPEAVYRNAVAASNGNERMWAFFAAHRRR